MATILFELNEAARLCSNPFYIYELRAAATDVLDAVALIHRESTRENMAELNCAWAHAERVLKNVPPEGDPAPLAGAPEAARLAA